MSSNYLRNLMNSLYDVRKIQDFQEQQQAHQKSQQQVRGSVQQASAVQTPQNQSKPLSELVRTLGEDGLKQMFPDGVQKHVVGGTVTEPMVQMPGASGAKSGAKVAQKPKGPASAEQVGGLFDKMFENTPKVTAQPLPADLLKRLGAPQPKNPEGPRQAIDLEIGDAKIDQMPQVEVGAPISTEMTAPPITIKIPHGHAASAAVLKALAKQHRSK